MAKFWRDPQNIIALGVTLISVCALIVSITQTRVMIRQSELMDRQARASVRPILSFEKYRAFDPQTRQLTEYRLVITNSGVGPASIDDVCVEYDGKEINSWSDIFASLNLPDSIPTYITTDALDNTVIRAGQTIALLDLTNNMALGRAIHRSLDDMKLKILYSSIYGDQFEGQLTSNGWVNKTIK